MKRGDRHGPTLVVVPALNAFVQGNSIGLTDKFVSGVKEFEQQWPGPVRLLMHPTTTESDNLDGVTFHRNELPFDLVLEPFESPPAFEALRTASVVLLSLEYRQTHLSVVCKRLGVPCAYISENTLETRLQIAAEEVKNPLRLVRRVLWEIAEEKRNVRAVSAADGIQCNGTPTFDAYATLNPSPLLFFDTRTSASHLASQTDLDDRFRARQASGVLRLAFSGRLISIKGAMDLVKVARALTRMGKKFVLSICGAGEREESMRAYVQRHKLESVVRFLGNLDFESELLPLMRRDVDLFVSCHRQGDPSCTYLETLACGVPIAGYDNEAWRGLSQRSGCGWTTQMKCPENLALRIAALTDIEIEQQSIASLKFAQAHTFEIEFRRRIEHLKSLATARQMAEQ